MRCYDRPPFNDCSFELLIPGKDIEDNVCDLCINWWVVMYMFFCIFFVMDNLFGFWIFCKHSFKYRLTCTRNDVFSFRINFFSNLNAHPHDAWVGIIERMNLNVFQYKLLIIPSNQDNHKSLFYHNRPAKCGCIFPQAYHLRPSLHSSCQAWQECVRIESSCSNP